MGRAKVTRTIHTLELSESTQKTLEEVVNLTPGIFISTALRGFPWVDAFVGGVGFYLGTEFNVGVPGGILLQHLGLPDYTEEVNVFKGDVEIWADRVRQNQELLDRWYKEGGHEQGAIDALIEHMAANQASLDKANALLSKHRTAQGLITAMFFVLVKHGLLTGIGEILPG